MVEEGQGSVESDLPTAEPQPRHDFSVVQGFQVVGGEDQVAAGEEAWRDALRLELEVRAARLHQAVDAAIVLSNDGVIRWLGDPVAKLLLGPNVLNPGLVILAHECLPDASREAIKTRIELWIAATARRVLAPLFALEAIQEGSEIVRDLAQELVRALGVLDREPIRAKVKALAQDDRSELRKQGVRFGAYYIFVPALLKPAPRNLALQLWSLQAPADVGEYLSTLGSVASSGRTSLSVDNGISKEGYRVAGYRPCGDRLVRVDVVERLAGMIRAAIAGEAPDGANGGSRPPASKGFIVSGQMTSLTGCSGEHFASILRSMGFRPVEMKRSDFFGPPATNETAPSEPPEPAVDQGPAADNRASSLAINEEEAMAEAVSTAPPAEPPPDRAPEGADVVPEDVDSVPQGADAVEEDVVEAAHEGADEPPPAVEPLPAGGESIPVEMAASLGSKDSFGDDSGVGADAQSAPAQTSAPSGEPAKNAEMIVVWRPDRSRIAQNRGRSESKHSTSGTQGRLDAEGHSPVPGRKWARNKKQYPVSRPTPAAPAHAAHAPRGADSPDAVKPEEKRRQRARDYDMPRLNATMAPQHNVKVDPNSPFAKLLELRSLLEKQAKRS
jgi:ATP-dependent RNA helicase SUPV3L1/SUV3